MDLTGKRGRRLLLMITYVLEPGSTTLAQNDFAVVQLANATDDVTINYRFAWGVTGQQYTIRANQHSHHDYRFESDRRNSYPIPEIQFATGIDRERKVQVYTLRRSPAPKKIPADRAMCL